MNVNALGLFWNAKVMERRKKNVISFQNEGEREDRVGWGMSRADSKRRRGCYEHRSVI